VLSHHDRKRGLTARLTEELPVILGRPSDESSCFRSFVSWLSDVQDLPPDQQDRIRRRSNSAMLWQRRSLHALKCFADDLVQVESS
jgi:hypothetical protein